ncbi:PAS domain S-box protein [Belnapia sp. T6]|uniref:histidine kinase n=1 Tax=Belnapia mucosa TaxID=2804532 RepID=A0ABS1V4G1_9PROT|nr:HWE histidine kinase domain-containing protein [Belnapia mucosa]MBL6456598.1 PAS domain S-box protein [Belnapia mucosa]
MACFDLGAVLIRALDGTILHWSTGCAALFGYSAEQALGRQAQELLATRFPLGGLRTAQDTLMRTGEWRGELRHRCRAGDSLVVAAHWILRCDPSSGEPRSVVEMHADASALKSAEDALRDQEARLLIAQEVAGVGTWEWDPEADSFRWSPEQYGRPAETGADAARPMDAFLACVHAEDRIKVREAARRALTTGEYEVEFRLLRPARENAWETLWLIGRGRRMPSPAGRLGLILGIHMDITVRKEAEARQELLMREVDHRAKNALAVVQAVLRLTKADTPEAFGRAIAGRVSALARAQTLLSKARWTGADLTAIMKGELAPFLGSAGAQAVIYDGPALTVAAVAAQPLSMTLHELATNAARYGSLSRPGGALRIAWSVDPEADQLTLHWTETGGPEIAEPPSTEGFGTRMIRATIQDQLGGTVAFAFRTAGLVCTITLPLRRTLARGAMAASDAASPTTEAEWQP